MCLSVSVCLSGCVLPVCVRAYVRGWVRAWVDACLYLCVCVYVFVCVCGVCVWEGGVSVCISVRAYERACVRVCHPPSSRHTGNITLPDKQILKQ